MSFLEQHLLSAIIFLPLGTGLLLLLLQRLLHPSAWRGLALGAMLCTFLFTLQLFWFFDPAETDYQFVEHAAWLPDYGIYYFVGVDGISLLLLTLTTFLAPLALLGAWRDTALSRGFVFMNLFLETAMLGAFASLNLFQFYIFWEVMLVPMYFIIGIWGGPRRIYAAVKFFLFTLIGSLLMLVAILVLYALYWQQFGALNFDFVSSTGNPLPGLLDTVIAVDGEGPWWQRQGWLFAAFALAFGIKVPIVPFHTWLPDAHVEAPTAGSVILAGVLLKMGTYGFVRFALPLFPVSAVAAAPLFTALALIGILYGALVAMVQKDIKKLVAYSSVSHLGFVMLGMFAFNEEGLQGSVLQMVNHGISTAALFLLVGMLYERCHTRDVDAFGGLARPMPTFAACFGVVMMSSIGLPATNGFVGEFLILVGAFGRNPAAAAVGAFGVVLSAAYMLWLYRRILLGPCDEPKHRALLDLNLREKAILVALLVPIAWVGIYPHFFLARLDGAVSQLLHTVEERSRGATGTLEVGQGIPLRRAP